MELENSFDLKAGWPCDWTATSMGSVVVGLAPMQLSMLADPSALPSDIQALRLAVDTL